MFKSIPKRPNLEFDRKQARLLFDAAQSNDPSALHRFAEFHPAGVPASLKLADAQCVVAREYGFPSWPQWKVFVEMRNLDRRKQADAVLKAVCSNDIARARLILAEDPALSREDFPLACACGEWEYVERELRRDASLATRKGGVNGWEAIQYACFSRWLRCDAVRAEGIVKVAEALLKHGANPNAFHMITWMDEPWKETVLFAASGIANNVRLTRLLLEAGADVNEGLPEPDLNDPKASPWGTEVLYHTCEFRDTACLELLLAAWPRRLCVSYCLARVLDFEYPDSVALMLKHGADPNFRYEGRTHLHRAVQNGRSLVIIASLLEAGADVSATDAAGRTAFQYAVQSGREDIEAALLAKGPQQATEGDRAIGDLLAGKTMELAVKIVSPDLVCAAARRNDVAALERLIPAGAELDASDSGTYGMPPLHWAAWRGNYEATRCLLAYGADFRQRNLYGGDAVGTAIHGSAHCFDRDGGPGMRLPEEALHGDYVKILEGLVEAGAKLPEVIWGGSEDVKEYLRKHGAVDAEEAEE